ncbi:MAG: PilZ domain-containing protein [Spirochaetales bacterium]|nr:PilZ domain-containing protein [Spirochaetales bacterium]
MADLIPYFYLLQSKLPRLQSGSPKSAIIVLVVFGVFIVIMLIAARAGSKRSGRGKSSVARGGTSFKRTARRIGLENFEIKILINLARKYQINNPNTFLNNSPAFDSVLRKSIEEIDMLSSEPNVKESRKALLFRIKQKIERNVQKTTNFTGTHQIKINQHLAISPETGGRYQSKIISNLRNNMGVQIPVNNRGQQIRWQKSMRLKVFFWKNNGQGFSFSSKVMGYNTIRGLPCLFIQHSNNIQQAQQRRFRRKELEKPAYFYPVRVVTTGFGRNKSKKAFVDSRAHSLGTVIDISAGGCALKSAYPLEGGQLVKIEFDTVKGTHVTVYGKILSMRKSRPYGGIMHIHFTKISREHLNKINSYVYDIDRE